MTKALAPFRGAKGQTLRGARGDQTVHDLREFFGELEWLRIWANSFPQDEQ